MTDAEAKGMLERLRGLLGGASPIGATIDRAIRHALQAIEDRAAFVRSANSEDWLKATCEVLITATHHMNGED